LLKIPSAKSRTGLQLRAQFRNLTGFPLSEITRNQTGDKCKGYIEKLKINIDKKMMGDAGYLKRKYWIPDSEIIHYSS
jgi:hypothetical protein